jgi:uncharacterized protein YbjT (DUF2867 family)
MILVTGATGKIGRALINILHQKHVAVQAIVRDPGRAAMPYGVEVVVSDYSELTTVAAAAAGADALFLMAPVPFLADYAAKMTEVAKLAGVRHIVVLSSLSVEMNHGNAFIIEHKAAETAVRNSGCDWTILRVGELASNTLSWAKTIKFARLVEPLIRNDPTARIDPYDVSAVAAAALTEPGHLGRIHELTGGETTTPQECAGILSKLLGSELTYSELSDKEAEERWTSVFGDSPTQRERIRTLRERDLPWMAVRPDVEAILGRRPRTYLDWAKANLPAFS